MKPVILTFLGFIYFATVVAQTPTSVSELPSAQRSILYFFVDTSNTISVEQARQRYINNGFKPVGSNVYNAGYSKSTHWISLKLFNDNTSAVSLMLSVKDPSTDELELFGARNNKIAFLGKTGDLLPFRSRPLPDRNFVFPISISAKDSVLYLLRIANHGHANYIPITIQDTIRFRQSSTKEYLLWGILSGVLLFVALFGIFIAILLTDRLYLYYVIYVLCVLTWIWSNSGMGYQFLWSDHPQVAGRIRFMSGGLMLVLTLHIMQLFLAQHKSNSVFFRYVNWFKWIMLAFVLVLFIPYDFSNNTRVISIFLRAADLLSLASLIVLYGSCIEKIRQGLKLAAYYLLAVICITLGGASLFLVRLGLIEANDFTLNLIYAGIVLEIIILTFGLTIRHNQYKKERERLLIAIREKEMQETFNIAIAKEEERRRIAADMHDDLGAGLSGLRLISELATRKNDSEELKKETQRIASSAFELSGKLRDIIWTLNTSNDSVERLLFYIHQYGVQLFEDADIQFSMEIPTVIGEHEIPGQWRKHVFLAVKEAFNNIIRHAGATVVNCIIMVNNELQITIKDNGKGFTPGAVSGGNGLFNMRHRIESLHGKMEIMASNGVEVHFIVPLPEKPDNPKGLL